MRRLFHPMSRSPWFSKNSVLLFLVLLAGLFCCLSVMDAQSDRVLLRDVTSITLRRGSYTTGRRSSPVPQLKCTGGTAYGQYSPKAVQCVNRGFDGLDVQWECKADMPSEYEFGKIEVSCEGYSYANDPYILAGSCGLNYELDYTSSGAKKSTYNKKPSAPYEREDTGISYLNIFYFLLACFVIYLLYTSLYTPRQGNEGDRRGSGFDNGPPPPPGWRQPPPPSYDESCKQGSGSQSNAGNTGSNANTSSGPGFFTGMGLGALGGYLGGHLFGGRNARYDSYGNQTFRRRNQGYNQFGQDTGFDGPTTSTNYQRHDSGGSSSFFGGRNGSRSSGTHTSTGFGGTSRR